MILLVHSMLLYLKFSFTLLPGTYIFLTTNRQQADHYYLVMSFVMRFTQNKNVRPLIMAHLGLDLDDSTFITDDRMDWC